MAITIVKETIGPQVLKTPLNNNFNIMIANDQDLQGQIDSQSVLIADRYTKAEVDAKDSAVTSAFQSADSFLQGQITADVNALASHIASTTAHGSDEIVNESTVPASTVSGALNTVQDQVNQLVVGGVPNATIGVYSFTASGAVNALTGTFAGVASLFGGLKINMNMTIALMNTGSCTLNFNALGVKNIYINTGKGTKVALSGGELRGICQLEYDGTDFVLLKELPPSTQNEVILDGSATIKSTFDSVSGMCDFEVGGATMNQVVVNGDFANGLNGWTVFGSPTVSFLNNVIRVVSDGTQGKGLSKQLINKAGDKLFISTRSKGNSGQCNVVLARNSTLTDNSVIIKPITTDANFVTSYGIFTAGFDNLYYGYGRGIAVSYDAEIDLGMVIPITGTPYENMTADQINNIVGEYWEGLKSTDEIEISSTNYNLNNVGIATVSSTLNSSGIESVSTTDDTSGYIRVKPSTTYYLSGRTVAKYYALYDSSKNFISATSITNGTIATTSATMFIKFSYLKTNLQIMLNEGSSALAYIPNSSSELYINLLDETKFSLSKILSGENKVIDTQGEFSAIKNNENYTLINTDVTAITNGANLQRATIPLSVFKGIKTQVVSALDNNIMLVGYTEKATLDVSGDVNTFVTDATNLYVQVALGTWGALVNAQTALTNVKSTYQLATPITIPQSQFLNYGIDIQGSLASHANSTTFSAQNYNLLPSINIDYPINLGASVDSLKNEVASNEAQILNQNKRLSDLEKAVGVYGVQWNETDDVWTRLGLATDSTDFNKVFPWNSVRRCNVLDNGMVGAYYGDPTFIENGTNGQVMVEYPKTYTKYLYYTLAGKTYHEWLMSQVQYEGFEVDNAFLLDGVEVNKIYIGAYEASIYDTSGAVYLLADEQIADFTVTTGDKLSSIAGAKPCSGLTQDLTIVKSRILSNNRGTGWGQWNALAVGFVQKLFMIEYASANSQTKIGLGVVNKTDDGLTNMANNTGATSFLGNMSGRQAGTDGLTSVSYRGLENMWGNIWTFVDGLNIQADNKLWLNMSNKSMVSDSFVAPYRLQGTLANANGYVRNILGNPNGLFATQVGGSSTTRIPDSYFQSTGNRVSIIGGGWDGGSSAGFTFWYLGHSSPTRFRTLGARLFKI